MGRARIAIFVAIVQAILLLGHWFVYATWIALWPKADLSGISALQVTFALLSVSFVAASLLAWRYTHVLVRLFYTIAAVWLGIGNFLLIAACVCWMILGAAKLFGLHVNRQTLAVTLFSLAVLASLYGIVNAMWIRVNRVGIKLPHRPESWRGRVAALVSDAHLGHVRGHRFANRIVSMLKRLRPDIVFIAGDWYDGTAADLQKLAEPWTKLSTPLGAYFAAGNHEEFSDHTKYLDALQRSGVRVLNNEKVMIDGVQVVGVHHADAADAQHLRPILQRAALNRDQASILLTHAPDNLHVAEEEGVSLQLSGHTHGGQIFPWTWAAARVYRQFAYGLRRLGNLTVYTSNGVGTWGPPLRVGTQSEIVLIQFE
jgi:predicted MPP superfamily phosphohydrolase